MRDTALQIRRELIDRNLGFAALRQHVGLFRPTTIALLDTAVDTSHPFLRRIAITAHGEHPDSGVSAHATAMASLIAGTDATACTNDDRAAEAAALRLHTWNTRMEPATPHAAQAARIHADIIDACSQRADAIVVGFEFISDNAAFVRTVASALAHASAAGVPVFVPAGNHGRIATHPLLAHPGVVPVCMSNRGGTLHHHSAWGPLTVLRGVRAVGEDLPVALPHNKEGEATGTSFSAALAARAFAALRSRWQAIGDAHGTACPLRDTAATAITAALRAASCHGGAAPQRCATLTIPGDLHVWAAYQLLSSRS
ncbi:hypothetical protein QN362_04445 [Actimicrobium sp. CCC2.4]|uniref:S8 family serine peptidase n=1 Tax=Actimicrobium sp. CCC2.4 TaxID=3048606 RepID=UPI002AC9A739|nr:S8 family serine peptidase [Actimicrobium sp. CCC2.4]MEB0134576.1 hypothetical protein [Actimicrobium sp. CCC2.4]WPX34018.1 hypothetical protein RHM62_09525 [Actimicrobium sp. CCC2.4]